MGSKLRLAWVTLAAVLSLSCSPQKSPQETGAAKTDETREEPAKFFEVKVGGKIGFINRSGQLVINPQFDEAGEFREKIDWVCLGKCGYDSGPEESRYGFIDEGGRYIVNPTYDHVWPFYEGLGAVCTGDCRWGGPGPRKWGYIDRKGTVIIPLQFGRAGVFREGLAEVCVGPCIGYGEKFQGKWGYINSKGAFVINPQFDQAKGFENGLAKVEVGKGVEAKIAYIDKTGNFIWNPAN